MHRNITATSGLLRLLKAFTLTKSCWPTVHQELFAVKWALEQFRHYLIGHKFKVITDHTNLKVLVSIAPQNSKLPWWCLSLAGFDFSTEYRPGKDNVVPDSLSYASLPTSHPEVNVLVTPPSQVSTFLVTLLGFDLCIQDTSTKLQPLGNSLTYLTLACSTQNPFDATALPPSLHKITFTALNLIFAAVNAKSMILHHVICIFLMVS